MNRMTLAVAGGRKTQSIIDACSDEDTSRRRLVVTYTLSGQRDVERRLNEACPPGSKPEVLGWYTFLMRHFIKPYLANFLPGRHLRGFDFDGTPARGVYATGAEKYLDAEGRAYKLHLSKLAVEVANASNGAVLDRLRRIYHEIYIDEVQDMTGCDLHILDKLIASTIDLFMVGDVRQSVFDTNPQDKNLTQYRGVRMAKWFTEREAKRLLELIYSNVTWRSSQEIADFSDSLFDSSLKLGKTESRQIGRTNHDGVFVVAEQDVAAYVEKFSPLCLRPTKATARTVDLPFRNFGVVKGLTTDRVLIYPSKPIQNFICTGATLADKTGCGLYVAVTRAKYSVVFVLPDPPKAPIQQWHPPS